MKPNFMARNPRGAQVEGRPGQPVLIDRMAHHWRRRILLVITLYSLLAACAVQPKTPGTAPSDPASLAVAEPGNAYYHYTESQISRLRGDIQASIQHLRTAKDLDPDALPLYHELAVLYLQTKDEEQALAVLEAALERNPNDTEALALMGRIYQNRQQLDDARAVYEKIIEQGAADEDTYLTLGNLYLDQGQLDMALDVFQQLVQAYSGSYAGFFFLGKTYEQQNYYSKAEEAYRRSLELEPELEGARFALIDLYRQRKDSPEIRRQIIDAYQEILNRDGAHVRAATELALYHQQVGQSGAGRKVLARLMDQAAPPEIVRNVYRLYIENESYTEAVFVLQGLLAARPDEADLHYLLGVAYGGIEEPAKAMQHFSKVTADSRFHRQATLQLAFQFNEKGEVDRAIHLLQQALQKSPRDAELMLYLGSLYEEHGRLPEAERTLLEAMELSPEDERIHFRIGVVYDKLQRKEDSITAMRRVIEINPEHANALNYLGYTFADLGVNLDEAEQLIRKALELKPEDGYITDSLGWVLYRKGLYEEALRYLVRASTLVPQDSIIMEHVGDAYLKAGRRDKALEYYQRALSLKDKEREPLEQKIRDLSDGAEDDRPQP
jgi:tetratricopeptide (TPR) repeat protein